MSRAYMYSWRPENGQAGHAAQLGHAHTAWHILWEGLASLTSDYCTAR